MKTFLVATLISFVALHPAFGAAQTGSAESESKSASVAESGVPLERLIATVAKKTGKKFLLDPRVRASVILVGQEPGEISYPQLLTVLEVYSFLAVEDGGYVRIVPDASARQQPVLTVSPKDTRPASEVVSEVIPVKYVSAAALVPILRPLLPQYAHLAALVPGNALIIVDRFANVRRIEALVKALDTPENKAAPKNEAEH